MATETLERPRAEPPLAAGPEAPRAAGSDIPIPDLQVRGFRGLDKLDIPKLSQVTLVAGSNGIGKTTVLEALSVFASRGSGSVLTGILSNRREQDLAFDEEGNPGIILDWESLFHGRSPSEGDAISIGVKNGGVSVVISVATPEEIERDGVEMAFGPLDAETAILKTQMYAARRYVPMVPVRGNRSLRRRPSLFEAGYPIDLRYETLGPNVINDDQLARMWDDIALSDELGNLTDSLSKMYGRRISGIAMTGDRKLRQLGRRAMVRLTDEPRPVPLKSLGDGAMRMAGYIMAVSRTDTDLVLADEIENGVHHYIQRQFWNNVIDAASRSGTQLIATTHSWDCIKGFTAASLENEGVECSLVRVGTTRITKRLRAVEYSTQDLVSATRHGIEVR